MYLNSWCAFDLPAKDEAANALEAQSAEPGFWDDQRAAQDVMREMASLRDTITLWSGLKNRIDDAGELLELAIEEQDEATFDEVRAELRGIERDVDRNETELAFNGPYDQNNAIVAINAGSGGTDSQDWAQMLLRMYLRWAEREGYRVEVVDETEGEEAGIKSATFEVSGPRAYGYLRHEKGVHRLVRLSPFDSAHAGHTSFAQVEVMPEIADDAGDVDINPDDLRIDVYRASGHGGQNVQKNSTAIRITHIPTGLVVTCQNERSQGRNKEMAMRVLRSRLLELELRKREEEQAKIKGEHVTAGWGNQIRSYVLHPYKMVKDLRTGHETSDTTGVLDGEIDEFLQASIRAGIGEG